MKVNLFILTSVLVLTTPALAKDEKLNFLCAGEGSRSHEIRVELTRATDKQKCSAIAVDATSIPEGPVTINSDWSCEVTKLSETPLLREELIQMKVTVAKAITGEAGADLRFETLRLILDTLSADGAGIGATLGKQHTRLNCRKDDPDLMRYSPN